MINIPATFSKPSKNNVTKLTGDDNKDGIVLMELSRKTVFCIVFCKNSPFYFGEWELEDIISETYTKAWGSRDSYNPAKGALSTWVNTIAYNIIADHSNRNRKYKYVPYDETCPNRGNGPDFNRIADDYQETRDDQEAYDSCSDATESPCFGLEIPVDTLYDEQELREFVKECVDKLETKDQDIFNYSMSGHKNKDIAGFMDMTPNAISIRLYRIREYLKEKLDWYVKEIRG